MLIILSILVLFTLLLYLQFLGYPLIMSRYISTGKQKLKKDSSFQPFISVIVPTFNEEKSIKNRLVNLLAQRYSIHRFEIIVVDSGSTDRTIEIVKEYSNRFPQIQIVEEGKRNGKASAINLGKAQAKGEIVVVTDANTVFNEEALKKIASYFSDPEVGAVGGRFVLTNTDNTLVAASSFYWDVESLMRRGESDFDSACLFHGEINAWRKDIVQADVQALSEDLEMAVQIRQKGYKIIYEPEAMAYEAGPTTEKEQITQKKRTTLGTIQCFFKHWRYFVFPHDKYSAVVFPCHKTLQIVSPFLLLVGLATFIALLGSGEFYISLGYTAGVLVLFSISYLILNKSLAGIKITKSSSVQPGLLRSAFRITYYVVLHEFIILLAWKDYFMKKYAVTWEKVESTRSQTTGVTDSVYTENQDASEIKLK